MHSWLDKYSVAVASATMRNHKWFTNSIESPTFTQLLEAIDFTIPEFTKEGTYEVDVTYQEEKLDPAFQVVQWIGGNVETIIYHHGNNEQPFNYHLGSKNTFKTVIMAKKELFKANIINLRAPFHNSSIKQYLENIGSLSNFTAMLTTSMKLVEKLVQYTRKSGSNKIIVSGISLGGWVTNLHRSFFNSADVYLPLLAGAALDSLFISSYYRNLTSLLAKKNPERLTAILNFEKEFTAQKTANVYPLLARYDQFIEFDRQKQCYGQTPIEVLPKGHITAALDAQALRQHLLRHLKG